MSELKALTVRVPQDIYEFLLGEQEKLKDEDGNVPAISKVVGGMIHLYMLEAKFTRAAKNWMVAKLNFPVLAQIASEDLYDYRKKK